MSPTVYCYNVYFVFYIQYFILLSCVYLFMQKAMLQGGDLGAHGVHAVVHALEEFETDTDFVILLLQSMGQNFVR